MECPGCLQEVSEGQKFCPECGRSLRGYTDTTQPIDAQTDTVDAAEDRPTTESALPPPAPAPAPSLVQTLDQPDEPAVATTQLPTQSPVPSSGPVPDGQTTDQMPVMLQPAVFDGSDDLAEYPEVREPFTLKVAFVFAFFGAVLVVLTALADIIDIRTSVPVDGIATGIRTLDTLGTNLAVAGFAGATVMAIGGLLACFGFRWGAGIAGGAGLALVGWACLAVGLAELRVAAAESTTRRTTNVAFTLRITRDLGYWLLVAVAIVGVLVFLASLRSFPNAGRPPLNPWIAALGAVGGVVLAAGPLLPVGDAVFADNFSSPDTTFDLPTLYFAGRLVQVGLIAFTVVLGLLVVRAYGLGLAAGGVSVGVWMWLSALLDLGTAPLGIAAGNFGADDTTPHAVTTVGMAATLLMLVVAAVLATVGHRRRRRLHTL